MSQAERILALLQSRDWVPLPAILGLYVASQVASQHLVLY
jgi:hypothetical protein